MSFRIILVADCAAPLQCLQAVDERLQRAFPAAARCDTVVLGSEQLADERSRRWVCDGREGDLLVALVEGDPAPSGELSPFLARAVERRLIVLPFRLVDEEDTAPAEDRSAFAGACVESLPPSLQGESLPRLITARILEQLALTEPAREAPPTGDHPAASGVPWPPSDLLNGLWAEPPVEGDGPAATAWDLRRRASRGIEARLFALASEALGRSLEFDPTSVLAAYWRARLLIASNQRVQLEKARQVASRAARRARGPDADRQLEIAAWLLVAEAAARLQDGDGVREALTEARLHPTSPDPARWLGLRLLHRAGLRETAIEWIRTALVRSPDLIRRLEADPSMALLGPAVAPLGADRSGHLESLLARLLGNEQQLLRRRSAPRGQTSAPLPRDGAHETAQDRLQTLDSALQSALQRQLVILNQWGTELVEMALSLESNRRLKQHLAARSKRLQHPSRLDRLLQNLWPRLRRKQAELNAAGQRAHAVTEELTAREDALAESLGACTLDFLEGVERFEILAVQVPELIERLQVPFHGADDQLVATSRLELRHQGISCDDALLPDALIEVIGVRSGAPALACLYRLEQARGSAPVATRTGVFFAQAYASPPRA